MRLSIIASPSDRKKIFNILKKLNRSLQSCKVPSLEQMLVQLMCVKSLDKISPSRAVDKRLDSLSSQLFALGQGQAPA